MALLSLKDVGLSYGGTPLLDGIELHIERGDRICLLGTLDQVDFLKTATPAEVDARTRETLRLGKPGGRYIFSTSDYLEIDTPRENVVAMIEAARAEGRY